MHTTSSQSSTPGLHDVKRVQIKQDIDLLSLSLKFEILIKLADTSQSMCSFWNEEKILL